MEVLNFRLINNDNELSLYSSILKIENLNSMSKNLLNINNFFDIKKYYSSIFNLEKNLCGCNISS